MAYAVPVVEGKIRTLYYIAFHRNQSPPADQQRPGVVIGRTTAPAPIGPWSPNKLVLYASNSGEWNTGFIIRLSTQEILY